MDEAEGYGGDTAGQNGSGESKARGDMLRVQAIMAWDRVQKVARRRPSEPSVSGVLDSLEKVSTGTYLAGIAGSMLASAWLYGTGRKDASGYAGVPVPLVLGLGLLWKTIRRAQRS